MAPTASMLFLSYRQLHTPTAATEAPPAASRMKEEDESSGAAAGGRLRVSLSSAPSLFARRAEAKTPAAAAKPDTRRAVAGEGEAEAASLESRFEEALRFSCWSS